MMDSIIIGTGAALPEKKVTNKELENIVDTSDEWIEQRTGIKQRYIVSSTESTVTLGAQAARQALANAEVNPDDIDLIILATATPDHTFPSSATEIQHALGIKQGFAFDIQAVCSGFVYALNTANAYLKTGMAKRALVIGSESFSRLLDWSDRTTCVLFGDGAGAVVLEAVEAKDNIEKRGIIAAKLRSDGAHKLKLYVDGGPATTQTTGKLRMQGKEVFKYAVSMITDVVEDCFTQANITGDDLDWFVPHQANRRIIESSAKKLGIAEEKVIISIDLHGNTSAASIPLALHHAVQQGKFKKNDLIMLEAMGGGFTWGAILLRW
ncbi:beta-ketoacyl-ACP synthase III [Bartonella sp. TP]|uniref:beta-ketoacyl-ACP synthase III n=1 Tax=Bartonella sp. TP TaxID=3057550 RepID=UPI0025B1B074|nr:beta-ketoacyl-ACP synthase III [Bartonella sp. TP]WJW80011.1 beta-ketoacyl-ACP synthase III [Bartonella sp. TP]